MSKAQNEEPLAFNPGVACRQLWQYAASDLVQGLSVGTLLASVSRTLPAQGENAAAFFADYDIPNWTGAESIDAAGSGNVPNFGIGDSNVMASWEYLTWTSANITDPQDIKAVLLSNGNDPTSEVLLVVPLASPWHVTANGQTLVGHMQFLPRAALCKFFRVS